MTYNEIIKALERLQESASYGKKYKYLRLVDIENYEGWDLVEIIPANSVNQYNTCVICKDITPPINGGLVRSALDLIKRQKAEIEEYRSKIYRQSDVVSEQKELIERIYNEAIKEFAERLKESPRKISMMSFTKEEISTYVPVHAIDSLVKEMTEGKDAGKDI